MATPSKSAHKTPSSSDKTSTFSKATDAISLLKADHAEVKECFQAYQKLVDAGAAASKRKPMAEKICLMLTVHSTIEQEIFYPAAREMLGAEVGLIDEADVEHASAKELIAQIEAMEPDEDYYDAKVKVLGEYIDHHVKEEQNEMFPAVKKAGMDIKAIGQELQARKKELMAEMSEATI